MIKPKVLLSEEQIAARTKEIAAEINRDYQGKSILILGTLTGSVVFLADLVRELTVDVQIDFIKISSYGETTESTRQIKEEYLPTWDMTGQHVVIVEDIVDTGHTAAYLRKYLADKNTASVVMCTLLDKPERREVKNLPTCEYIGFTIPNAFVVGYGLDFNQKFRQLPYIGVIE
ncbi:MAG: hypoxanthine phosphoribosyltransferase [Firmicutes bacterium]|nr:hypoxanthine phosphoribosyltransferase [Bacillota bacterium]